MTYFWQSPPSTTDRGVQPGRGDVVGWVRSVFTSCVSAGSPGTASRTDFNPTLPSAAQKKLRRSPVLPVSPSGPASVWLRFTGRRGKGKKKKIPLQKTTTLSASAHQPPHRPDRRRRSAEEEEEEAAAAVCWFKDRDCLGSSHIFHQLWNSPPFLGINGSDFL